MSRFLRDSTVTREEKSREEYLYLPMKSHGGTTHMQHETSYVWERMGAQGQHRFICKYAMQEIGEVSRPLRAGGGHEWACKTLDGVVMRATRKENAAHLLRKAAK